MLIAWVRRQREWNFMLSGVIALVLALLNSTAIPIHIPGLEGIVEKLLFGLGIWVLAQGYHAVLTRINLFEATSQFPCSAQNFYRKNQKAFWGHHQPIA